MTVQIKFDTLTDAVCLLKRENGEHIIPVRQYYIDRVVPMGRKYAIRVPDYGSSKGVCPLHDDRGPSFGILKGSDGRERFNCFGCEKRGHIVDLHREFELRWNDRSMGMLEAARDLLRLYKIDVEPFLEVVRGGVAKAEEIVDEREARRRRRAADMASIKDSYTAKDYGNDVVAGILSEKPLGYFNTLLFKSTMQVRADADNNPDEKSNG